VLTLTDLHKAFAATVAVDGLSLRAVPGEILGLLGPSGAGKSTTIHLALGLLVPDTGTVTLDGLGSPTDSRVRRHIGLAPQALALYADLTGEENLRFLGRVHGVPKKVLEDRVDWALDFSALTDRRGVRVGSYSGGMQRRLNLAAALLHEPRVVLLDEPTTGADPQSRDAILERIRELKRSGLTVVRTSTRRSGSATGWPSSTAAGCWPSTPCPTCCAPTAQGTRSGSGPTWSRSS
jgi:ABC-2 type transport system ATP-binding protein